MVRLRNKIICCCFLVGILTAACEDIFVKQTASDLNVEDFEAAWNRVNDVYPFLGFKGIDWDSLHTVYRLRSEEAEGDGFYPVLGDLLAELKDGHAYYKTDGGDEVYPYYPDRHFKDRHSYSPIVVRRYFNSELILAPGRSAEYGITPDNIGYVFLSDFHNEYYIHEFPGIVQYLINTKGLIIDIRQKRGGDYQNVKAVVSMFISEPIELPKLYFLEELIPQSPLQPYSDKIVYSKPVVVLINGSTFSAGELTSEIMGHIPGITLVGDTTGGGGVASSNSSSLTAAEYKLPSGKIICIGSGYFERYDGLPFEWLGIPPDVYVEQTEADINNNVDKQLEYAMNFLNLK